MHKKLIVFCLALVVLILPVGANACWVSITATNEIGSQTLEFTDKTLSIIEPVAILDGFIDQLVFSGKADPEIGVEFGVRAGGSATIFTIASGLETFAALTDPYAYASAGVTLTDKPEVSGATITGNYPGGKTNQALYNGTTAWANLVNGFTILTGSDTRSEEKGNEFSMIAINGTITSIESNFSFTLSARDSASGTSTFVVVPEPATVALLGLGGLALLRRKRAN